MTKQIKFRQTNKLADILRQYISDYQHQYHLHPDQNKIVFDILNCRTAYLGGHIERCDKCGAERRIYHSCRNRHCPTCQHLPREQWLEARKSELLPVPYFHNVFTLPHDLNPIILSNKKVMLNILFRSVAETQNICKKQYWGPSRVYGHPAYLGPAAETTFSSALPGTGRCYDRRQHRMDPM